MRRCGGVQNHQKNQQAQKHKANHQQAKGLSGTRLGCANFRMARGFAFDTISPNANLVKPVGLLMFAQYPNRMGSHAQGLTQRRATNRRHTDQHCLWMPIYISHRRLLTNLIQFSCQSRAHQVWKLQFPNPRLDNIAIMQIFRWLHLQNFSWTFFQGHPCLSAQLCPKFWEIVSNRLT